MARIRPDIQAVSIVTLILFIYIGLLRFESTRSIAIFLFLISPFLIVWMVYIVLRKGSYDGKELGDEEFGYCDRDKNKMGVF